MARPQHGFSAIVVLLIVVGVAVAGFVAWRLYNGGQGSGTAEQPPSQANSTGNNQQQHDPNAGYVVISEWGVRFKPVAGLTNVEYFTPDGTSADAVSVVTAELVSKEPGCGKDGGMIPVGLLSRTASTPSPEQGGVIAEIGGYTYQYRVSDAACSENEENLDLESRTGNLILQSVKTLEAKE